MQDEGINRSMTAEAWTGPIFGSYLTSRRDLAAPRHLVPTLPHLYSGNEAPICLICFLFCFLLSGPLCPSPLYFSGGGGGAQPRDDEVSGKGGSAIHYRRWKGADKSPYQPCLLPTEPREQSQREIHHPPQMGPDGEITPPL